MPSPYKTSAILKMSQIFAPTLKENPVDAEIASHRLLTRGAMIRKVASGVYSFLPLGYKVLQKVEQIVREEMDKIGSQEMKMSIIQPAELWHESGRWDVYGPELMRFKDRHGHGFALSPTQEELITSLVRNELRSYKELPKSLYHIQWKYRDEIRPRFGLLRGREFLMKDAYSFHATQESLQAHYDEQAQAYGRICERLGLDYRCVEADSGQIGGSVSMEFMALADAGEAELVYCECGYAANIEVATPTIKPLDHKVSKLEKIHTPVEGTIAALAEFLKIPEAATVKALSIKEPSGKISVLFIPGDHELGEIKANKALPGYEFLTDEEMLAAGLVKGFMGPISLPKGVCVVADNSLKASVQWVVGANELDHHYVGASQGKDFAVDMWADLAEAKPGDLCPNCEKPLEQARGIEVSQVFQLGTKYSEAMNAFYMDEDGSEKPFIMGCYGWGVTRSLAAIVEQYNDEGGIKWPISAAPAEVAIIPLASNDEAVLAEAQRVARELAERGIEVIIDDRDERAGVKFNDADLIGWPYQVVIGKRGVESGELEIKIRNTSEKISVPKAELVSAMAEMVESARARYY